MPSSSDSNQVVVEQWETESDSFSHSLSLKMEENIAERFSLLPFFFSQCGTLPGMPKKTLLYPLQVVLISANE